MMFANYTQKQLKDKVRLEVDKIGLCMSIKTFHPELWGFFMALFERHSDYPEKFIGLIDAQIRYNQIYKSQLECIIIKKNGDEDDVSIFNNCITGKPKDNLTIAMRNSIVPQIYQFKNISSLICELCESIKDIHIDHYEPQFVDLKTDFIDNYWKGQIPINFESNESNSKIFTINDINFEKEWFDYHKQNATLRVLCRKCNLSREKSRRCKSVNN